MRGDRCFLGHHLYSFEGNVQMRTKKSASLEKVIGNVHFPLNSCEEGKTQYSLKRTWRDKISSPRPLKVIKGKCRPSRVCRVLRTLDTESLLLNRVGDWSLREIGGW